ncbi:MAG: secretin N-terminal domain-containing protein [Myxococcota bacterium]
MVTLKQEAELQDLVEWMMSVSCQKFIWPAKLRTAPINIVAPEPVTMAEAYAAFHAALAAAGAAVVPAGDFYRIVEAPEVAKRSFRVYGPGADVPADDRYVTKVWRPDEGRQEITASLLRELKTESGVVKTVGDIVIVTDTGHRIRTLERLVDELAVAQGPHRKIHLYGVRHAEAETLAELVRTVFADGLAPTSTSTTTTTTAPKAKAKSKTRSAATTTTTSTTSQSSPTVTVDARTGTLLVVSTDTEFAAISRLLDELDVDAGEGRESLHVIELSHLDAAEVEAVLNNLANPSTANKGAKSPRPATVGETISGSVKVTAHAATQSLIVSANALDFAALERVVRRIDRPRRQLYLEVYLLEVRAELRRSLDVGAHFGRGGTAGGVGYASSSPGSANAFSFDPSLLTGLTAGLVGPTIPGSLLGLTEDIPSFGVTLQALETQEDVDIVAQPHLYAAENEEAVAEFGETVPVNVGTSVLPDTGGAQINTVGNEKITLKLQVTPYVSHDETIALDIILEDKQLGQQEASNNNYRTLTRSLDLKKVVAHPGQPLVLGGLTREVEGISDGRVPGLGSIPVLGWLFRKRARRKEKVSLLMVMVPHLIESPADARRIHLRRMQERQEFIERYTAFERRGLDTHVNYRKKSGLLSAVGVAVSRQASDAEHAAAAEAELHRTRISTTIDPAAP